MKSSNSPGICPLGVTAHCSVDNIEPKNQNERVFLEKVKSHLKQELKFIVTEIGNNSIPSRDAEMGIHNREAI